MEHLITSGIKAAARRHLVRMEVEVALRRQCYASRSIAPERMHFYKRPLHLKNWEKALQLGIRAATRGADVDLGEDLAKGLAKGGAAGPGRVLVATGAHDSVARPEVVRPLFAPRDVRVFEDCGHLSQEECPEELVRCLVDFLRG